MILEDKKYRSTITNVAEKELDLLIRHVEVLKTVQKMNLLKSLNFHR